jgi:hypothetical protein
VKAYRFKVLDSKTRKSKLVGRNSLVEGSISLIDRQSKLSIWPQETG